MKKKPEYKMKPSILSLIFDKRLSGKKKQKVKRNSPHTYRSGNLLAMVIEI